jgi:ATP-dependent Zn protease
MPDIARLDSRNRNYWAPVVLDFFMLLDSALSDREGIVVLGATNTISDISGGILRPGRMERAIEIGPPNAAGLTRILRTQLGQELVDADLMPIAQLGEGATAAEAMDFVRAARRTARQAGRPLILTDLVEQIRPPDTRSGDDRYRAAVHEAGHAVLGVALGTPVKSVSIARRAQAGGQTVFEEPASVFRSRSALADNIVAILGGAAAEKEILGDVSTGPGGPQDSDFAKVTSLAAGMHASYAMHDGPPVWRSPPAMATALLERDSGFRSAVEAELGDAMSRANDLARTHRQAIRRVADALVAEVRLDGTRISELMRSAHRGNRTRRKIKVGRD